MSERKNRSVMKVVLIAHALLWAGAILAAAYLFEDKLWSSNVALWAPVVFVLLNGLIYRSFGGMSRPRC